MLLVQFSSLNICYDWQRICGGGFMLGSSQRLGRAREEREKKSLSDEGERGERKK
jgi:hypothetical protein